MYVPIEVGDGHWWVIDQDDNPNEPVCQCANAEKAMKVAAALNGTPPFRPAEAATETP